MTDKKSGTGGADFSFPHLVKWAEMATRAESERALANLPISGSQLFVIVLLDERGEATSAELARMMRITPQALTTLLRPLRDDGFITRTTDAAHRRRLPLSLTDKGAAVLRQARDLSPAVEDKLLARFSSDERRQFKEMLARLARDFD